MQGEARVYALPRWRVTRWLVDTGVDVPADIRAALLAGVFGTLPIFISGVVNTLLVSGVIAARLQTLPVIAWFALEIAVCVARLAVLVFARRAALQGRDTATDLYLLLGVAWSGTVGYGVFVCLMSGDWVAAAVACLSAAAMVGGICFRNFNAPRLAGAMILTSIGPCLPAAALAGEPLLYVLFLQAPLYSTAMMLAAFKLNKMLIATMRAERENDYRARHDALTGLSNRLGLVDAIDQRMAMDPADRPFALLFLDLDGFKAINDTYGHAAGDQLLKMVADRISGSLGAGDFVARMGGDEFVVLANTRTTTEAMALGQQLITTIERRYDIRRVGPATVGVSIGFAMAPVDGATLDDLLAVADIALYEAKSSGKSRCCTASICPDRTLPHSLVPRLPRQAA